MNHVSLGGPLAGLKVNARQGEIYRIDFQIEDGKAWIWAEDQQGRRVSQVMRGVGYSHLYRHLHRGWRTWPGRPQRLPESQGLC